MWHILRSARKVYKQWRALPVEQRERYQHHAADMRSLVRELLGPRTAGFLDDDDPAAAGADARPPGRPQAEILTDLKDATQAFAGALASSARAVAGSSAPLSARLTTRLTRAGTRHATSKASSKRSMTEEDEMASDNDRLIPDADDPMTPFDAPRVKGRRDSSLPPDPSAGARDGLATIEYTAVTLEISEGYAGDESGDSVINRNLRAWAAAGWSLHSQSITMASTGINHLLVVLLVYERAKTPRAAR